MCGGVDMVGVGGGAAFRTELRTGPTDYSLTKGSTDIQKIPKGTEFNSSSSYAEVYKNEEQAERNI